MRKKTTIIVCLLLVACMLMVSAVVVAPKPDKPPKPPPGGEPDPTGTIYMRLNDYTEVRVWTMKAADGSDQTILPVESQLCPYLHGDNVVYYEAIGLVSKLKHNDHYWFIRQGGIFDVNGDPELYPDGFPRHELFAVRDDNAYNIQLTDDATLAIHGKGYEKLAWGADDSEILFAAKKWIDGELDMNSFGVYSIDVEFDTDGIPQMIGDARFVWDTGYFYAPNWDRYSPNITAFDISPDGNKLVLSQRGGAPISVVDLILGTVNRVAYGTYPKWSPDGTKIAFCNGGLCTINPDGTDEQVIVAAKSTRRSTTHMDGPICWSPDSDFIAYKEVFRHDRKGNSIDLYWVRVNGDDPTCITSDISGSKHLRGWR